MIATPEHQARRHDDRPIAELARAYGQALLVGDGVDAERVVTEALRVGHRPTAVQALIIEPAMRWIGELWESGVITVADEHLATAISQRSLIPLLAPLDVARPHSRERILLAAVEGQHHTLGLRMVADVLDGAGFDVPFLGADVRATNLGDFGTRHQPAVTGLAFGINVKVAERIRHTVHDGTEPTVSTSIGIGPLTVDRRVGQIATDVALYEAKAGGRDRVIAAPSARPA